MIYKRISGNMAYCSHETETPKVQQEGPNKERKDYKIPPSYESIFDELKDEIQDSFDTINRRKREGVVIYPDQSKIFRAFELTPLDVNLKVVIIGQDPYFGLCSKGPYTGKPMAQGLSFSLPKGEKISSSLSNIFKEVNNCYPDIPYPKNGDLSDWAKQGVLLLNSSLTVEAGKPNSHKDVWTSLTSKIISTIANKHPKVCFVLWGKESQKLSKYLKKKTVTFESSHPSGLSANRGFIGCEHFRKVNDYLQTVGLDPINWKVD